MRKLQQVALVVAAAGGLSAIGAGASNADAPVGYNGYGGAPSTTPQQDAPQAAAWTAAQATSHASGYQAGPQAAPQAAAPQPSAPQVNPQVNPQFNPKLSPQIAQVLPQASQPEQNNLFRPYQECSPETFLDANLPIGVLAAPQTFGTTCTQANTQANAFATAR
ncbi:hypothetical protein AB0C96_15730 [Streptomyces sp. NPDC048506]|uniref:hypothetical protein n=1 Tax=Streptomyces sp. NPDC048506 TaxID=3155028 RepID=UPI0034310853